MQKACPGRCQQSCEPIDDWYSKAIATLVEHARSKDAGSSSKQDDTKARGKQRKNAALMEAQTRLATLSTSSDKVGVSFAGAVFQQRYFETKFERRGKLLFDVLNGLVKFLPAQDQFHVASFGGGPGTDASGLVWLQRRHYPESIFHCMLYDREKTWKRYLKVLQSVFGEKVLLDFAPCDVTQSLGAGTNQRVSVENCDLLLFFYVCNETSVQTAASEYAFYTELAMSAKPGCLVVIADVMLHSELAISNVVSAIRATRACDEVAVDGNHNAQIAVLKMH